MSNSSIQRTVPGLASGAATLICAWPIAHRLGITPTIDALMELAGAAGIAVLCLWYGMVFAAIAITLRLTAMLCGWQWMEGSDLIDRMSAAVKARVRKLWDGTKAVLHAAIGMPVIMAVSAVWKPFEDWLFEKINAFELERQLRAEYRRNFRTQYRTFAEFKRAYYGEEEKPAPKDSTMSAADALSMLGLTDTCTQAELEAKHRALMKKIHPDVGGTDGLAAKLNEARYTIIKSRGWKQKGEKR